MTKIQSLCLHINSLFCTGVQKESFLMKDYAITMMADLSATDIKKHACMLSEIIAYLKFGPLYHCMFTEAQIAAFTAYRAKSWGEVRAMLMSRSKIRASIS